MALIKEPLNVDFVVDPKSLTKKEKEAISQYIRTYKAKKTKRKNTRAKAVKDKVLT